MYFLSAGCILVLCSLCVSVVILTVSNAFVMSNATKTVLLGGGFWLKPSLAVCSIVCSADVVL